MGPFQGLSTEFCLFFSWLASGLKDTLKLFSAGKGDEHHHPLVLASATNRVTYHITSHHVPGDANLTPSLPCLLPVLETTLWNPQR